MDIEGLYRGGEQAGYFKPYEIYREQKVLGVDFSIGRRKFDWSTTDEYWRQGLVQSRFLEEKMLPESAGLVGLFAQRKWSNGLQVRAGFLPVFIPEIGPQFSMDDGAVVSRNPWFQSPPQALLIEGIETPLKYELTMPSLGEIVQNPGGITSVGWQGEQSLVQFTYAYKPMPQLIYGFPFGLELADRPSDIFLAVDVRVRTIYHHLSHAEWEQRAGRFRFSNSVTYEAPGPDRTPNSWLSQAVSEAWIASSVMHMDTGVGVFHLGGLQVWGGLADDRGEFRPESGSVFESRFQFRQAGRLGWTSLKGFGMGGDWQMRSEFTFDFLQAGLLWLNEIRYSRANYGLFARLDWIGLASSRAIEEGFLANYAANDRAQVGFHVFF